MIIEVETVHNGEMPYTYSMNLSFIKPGPDIPIKVSLRYIQGVEGNSDWPHRMEIQAIHFQTDGILINYSEQKINNSRARGWKREVAMFRRQTHLIDESFKPEMTLKADDFGIKADIGTLQGVYSVHGLYENETKHFLLLTRYIFKRIGKMQISYKIIFPWATC